MYPEEDDTKTPMWAWVLMLLLICLLSYFTVTKCSGEKEGRQKEIIQNIGDSNAYEDKSYIPVELPVGERMVDFSVYAGGAAIVTTTGEDEPYIVHYYKWVTDKGLVHKGRHLLVTE